MRLAVLVSGRGSNLEAVLDAVADGRLPRVTPVLVVSNRPGVQALSVAAAHGIPAIVLRRSEFADVAARDRAIGRAIAESGAELALLAGYDRMLASTFFDEFAGPAINIHPSLLPRHGGKGMLGMAVHRSVLAAGDAESGVTVHRVTPELDAGATVAQLRVAVDPGESAEELAKRVLAVEHRLVVEVLASLAAQGPATGSSASMTAGSPPARSAHTTHERRGTHA
jgi:phosphoribosylglycinamide formyltransferase 1